MRAAITVLLSLFALSAKADPAVTTYHGSLDRAGVFVAPGLTQARARGVRPDNAFHANFQGHVYAQPLLWRDRLIVATENDEVIALDARDGAQIWKRDLGVPAPRTALPCGNISPLGVTGAPAIDGETLYLDAAELRDHKVAQEIYALSLRDGAVMPGWPVDVAAALGGKFDPRLQNQRGALAVFHGGVFVPYSGHWGDCGAYHGFVVGVALDDPHRVKSFETLAQGGGIWAQGGVSGDGRSLFVVTGNTFEAKTWGDGEAVLRLPPALTPPKATTDYFAPSDWRQLDDNDLDLGGTQAVPLDLGDARLLLAIGKNGVAYLLDRDNLGGVGAAPAAAHVADNVVISSPAVARSGEAALVVFQGDGAECPRGRANGLVALKITAAPRPAMTTAWCAAVPHAGAPIVTTDESGLNAIVWVVGAEGDNRLHAFDAATGAPLASPPLPMRGLHHFQTLIAGDGRLYVAADDTVYAFTY